MNSINGQIGSKQTGSLNSFNDRSKFKGLDQSVAFDMKGYKDNEDWSSLALIAVALEKHTCSSSCWCNNITRKLLVRNE